MDKLRKHNFFVSIKYLWILACLEGHGNWVCCFIKACRHVEKMHFEGKTGWKKSWDKCGRSHVNLSLLEINAPSWHVLVILPFLDWDIHESFRKEKAWLKSANWNKIFAYNRGMASAWAIHSFKTKTQSFSFTDFTLFVKFNVPTDRVQWLVQYILATWSCLPHCFSNMSHPEAAKFTLKADRAFYTVVKSYSKLLCEGLYWHLKCHTTV